MQAGKVELYNQLLKRTNRIFKIPVYQRSYDWTEVQCEQLFRDIISAYKNNRRHFLGTLVYISDSMGSTCDELRLVDGQQRLTTMYILLKVMYDKAKEIGSGLDYDLEHTMFNPNVDALHRLKIQLVKGDNEQLQLLFANRYNEMNKQSNLYINYFLFRRLLDGAETNNITLDNVYRGIEHLDLVEIILDRSDDDPQKIFESINSTGLALSLSDLVRNYLLMDVVDQEYLYEEYWQKIEVNVGYHNLGDFFVNYLEAQLNNSVNAKNAYKRFKEYCEGQDVGHEEILKRLERHSKFYCAFVYGRGVYSSQVIELLHAFFQIKQNATLPLLFCIMNDYDQKRIDEYCVCQVLSYLLNYVIRMTVCETGKNMSGFLRSMYRRIIDNDYSDYYQKFVDFLTTVPGLSQFPSDEDFRDALVYKPLYPKKCCRYLLFMIENSTKERVEVDNLTVEHILPQKENAISWKKALGDEYGELYAKYLHTLGNLTITGHNSELGTRGFEDKKCIIEASKVTVLNKDVVSASRWDEASIVHRADALARILIQRFPYVCKDKSSKKNDQAYLLGMFEAFKGCKPVAFECLGYRMAISSWRALLQNGLECFYEYDTETMCRLAREGFSFSEGAHPYLNLQAEGHRAAKQIKNTGIYFETNLSAKSIAFFLLKLLPEFSIDESEFLIYLSSEGQEK